MDNYKVVIKEIDKQVGKLDPVVKVIYREARTRLNQHWYRIYVKGIADNLGIECELPEAPSVAGVKIMFAENNTDVVRMMGDKKGNVPIPAKNVWKRDDVSFIQSSKTLLPNTKDNQELIAVIYRDYLWFGEFSTQKQEN